MLPPSVAQRCVILRGAILILAHLNGRRNIRTVVVVLSNIDKGAFAEKVKTGIILETNLLHDTFTGKKRGMYYSRQKKDLRYTRSSNDLFRRFKNKRYCQCTSSCLFRKCLNHSNRILSGLATMVYFNVNAVTGRNLGKSI